MSNIVTGAYLNALADFLHLKILPSVPYVAIDMAQAVADYAIIQVARHADNILVVNTKFEVAGQDITGKFITIFTPESLEKMLKALQQLATT
jgi:chemotaxis protein CheC